MRDYKKQIKNLRYCSKSGNCNLRCPRFSFAEDCLGKMTKEAADAIEELQAERDRYKSFFDRITDLPDCNICLKKNRCEFRPQPGEHTRINCAFCLTAPPKEVE